MKATPRRSISFLGLTYQRLGDFAEREGKSRSGTLEEWIHEAMDAVGQPVPSIVEPPKKTRARARKVEPSDPRAHFTF